MVTSVISVSMECHKSLSWSVQTTYLFQRFMLLFSPKRFDCKRSSKSSCFGSLHLLTVYVYGKCLRKLFYFVNILMHRNDLMILKLFTKLNEAFMASCVHIKVKFAYFTNEQVYSLENIEGTLHLYLLDVNSCHLTICTYALCYTLKVFIIEFLYIFIFVLFNLFQIK